MARQLRRPVTALAPPRLDLPDVPCGAQGGRVDDRVHHAVRRCTLPAGHDALEPPVPHRWAWQDIPDGEPDEREERW